MTDQGASQASATRVAIIMDGNGRWAADHGLPVLEGHRRGAKTMKQTVKDAVAVGIRELTVYAFSTENWSRPDDEVSGLMEMFGELITSETPLNQLSNVATSDARLLTVTPYDKSSLSAIEKAIMESDVGLTPSNDGNVIRLQIPELNEERRRDMVKVVHGVAEEGRIAIRNIRRDVISDLRELKKDGDVGEDDERRAEAELQKVTDKATGEIDALMKGKEEEILTV